MPCRKTLIVFLLVVVALVARKRWEEWAPLPARAEPAAKNPVELGKIRWHRNFHDAQSAATKQKKPILLLFQEVPG